MTGGLQGFIYWSGKGASREEAINVFLVVALTIRYSTTFYAAVGYDAIRPLEPLPAGRHWNCPLNVSTFCPGLQELSPSPKFSSSCWGLVQGSYVQLTTHYALGAIHGQGGVPGSYWYLLAGRMAAPPDADPACMRWMDGWPDGDGDGTLMSYTCRTYHAHRDASQCDELFRDSRLVVGLARCSHAGPMPVGGCHTADGCS